MIALDANGADAGAAVVVEGARRTATAVTLFGPAAEIADPPGEVVDAPVAIGGDEEPARAVRLKPDASIVQAARAVGGGGAEAQPRGDGEGSART